MKWPSLPVSSAAPSDCQGDDPDVVCAINTGTITHTHNALNPLCISKWDGKMSHQLWKHSARLTTNEETGPGDGRMRARVHPLRAAITKLLALILSQNESQFSLWLLVFYGGSRSVYLRVTGPTLASRQNFNGVRWNLQHGFRTSDVQVIGWFMYTTLEPNSG